MNRASSGFPRWKRRLGELDRLEFACHPGRRFSGLVARLGMGEAVVAPRELPMRPFDSGCGQPRRAMATGLAHEITGIADARL